MRVYSPMRKLIIIPAYNEAESILNVINELQSGHSNYDYVVVNDGDEIKT